LTFTVAQIESELLEDFRGKYKAFGGFVGSAHWNRCVAELRDVTLLGHIIFANDVLEIPPTHTYLRARPVDEDLTEFEKRTIGAFWGFVFKFVFGRRQRSVTARVNTVRTATYFYDCPETVTVANNDEGELK
jgi:hypothetical protein